MFEVLGFKSGDSQCSARALQMPAVHQAEDWVLAEQHQNRRILARGLIGLEDSYS